MSLPDFIEKANQPQVSIPTTTTAATVGLLSASEWLTILSICVVVMQLIIALPRFVAVLKSWARWVRHKIKGESGKATRLLPAALLALSLAAAPFVAGWEGTKNEAYLDAVQVPTICMGHTATAALGQVKTDAECEALLQQDLAAAFNAVARHVHDLNMPESRWIALGSFVFNVGEGNFARSTLLRKLNAGDVQGACDELRRWVYAKGQRLRGLERRREAERALCLQEPPPVKLVATGAARPWWKFWARWF